MNSWMPSWGLVLLTVAYLLILAVHLRHLLEVRGEARIWHLVHVLMALGMVNMAIPTSWTGLSAMPVDGTATGYFFAVITLFCAVMTGFALADQDRVATLWAMVSIGAGGMTWMYLYVGRDGWYAAVTAAFVAWFLLEAFLWASGRLTSRVLTIEETVAQAQANHRTPGSGWDTASPSRGNSVMATTEHVQEQVQESAHISHQHSRLARATLAVMALGMAWMLLAMQFGSDMAGMTGMSGSGHHH